MHTKLAAARARLMLERPFIGALAMHLSPEPASVRWCETIATDARAFYFNPQYIASLAFAEVQFVLAHTALHCALGHFGRRAHRSLRRWDIACDHAVNLLLIDDGMSAPAGVLADNGYRGLSAEEIYALLPADAPQVTLDRHIADAGGARFASSALGRGPDRKAARKGAGEARGQASVEWDDAGDESRSGDGLTMDPHALEPSAREALESAWQGRMVAAAQQARRAGRLSSSWMRLVDEYLQPTLPWRVLLARRTMSAARDDYGYRRLSRRDGDALMPRLASGEVDLCVALDTSASVDRGELAAFTAEIDSLKSQLRARLTLLACDERLDERGPWTFEPWEPLLLPHAFKGGAGTSFVPVFDWIARHRIRPDALVYFTDAEGDFPSAVPDFPVVWVVKGNARVPWGERIQLN